MYRLLGPIHPTGIQLWHDRGIGGREILPLRRSRPRWTSDRQVTTITVMSGYESTAPGCVGQASCLSLFVMLRPDDDHRTLCMLGALLTNRSQHQALEAATTPRADHEQVGAP